MKPKYCVNCVHFVKDSSLSLYCARNVKDTRNLVTGEIQFSGFLAAYKERAKDGACGESGEFFKKP